MPSYSGITRIKIGWSEQLANRLNSYRTIVPDIRVLAVWHTTDSWFEQAALRRAEILGNRVGQELFEFQSIPDALNDIIELFAKWEIPISRFD